ncbi:MAG: ATP-binding protein [Mariprofundaceae bacterium]
MEPFNALPTIAPLVNVSLCMQGLQQAIDRPMHLPGMIVMHGPSGYGKSFAAAFVANKLRAYHVECRSSWTKKALLMAILKAMGIPPEKTIYEMADQIAEQLVLSQLPLIIDEMDHIVEKKSVEIIRDIYETSGAAILLIGEERLPQKLKKWERFHGRILNWVPAQPAGIKDTKCLAKIYCRDVAVSDDLLNRITEIARGSVRRVCVNLENIRHEAESLGRSEINLATWGSRPLFSGEAAGRRI